MNEYKFLNIIKINLNSNQINDNCMTSLGELLYDNHIIESVLIGGNRITDKGIELLLPFLVGNTTLRQLDISSNKGITQKSIPALFEIAMKSYLETINIEYTSILDENQQQEIKNILLVPIDQREIPLITVGFVKSAAKIKF